MRVRKPLKIMFAAIFLLIAIESISSMVIFRWYAHGAKILRPVGSASLILAERLWEKVRGIPNELTLSIDHKPLFVVNDKLGFGMAPGSYQLTERYNGMTHYFDVTVNDSGRRATSYKPVRSPKRIFITGDSAFFGWGLDDEEAIPWLLQARLPDYEIINLTLTSYSTIHAILQLQDFRPQPGPDDLVIVGYHPMTSDFDVMSPATLVFLGKGYEMDAGDAPGLRNMHMPFGEIDAQGKLAIRRIDLACWQKHLPQCAHPPVTPQVSAEVTKLAVDAIKAFPSRLVMAFISGPDDDPVIAHMKSQGVVIADLRPVNGVPDRLDVIPTDWHFGPFWNHQAYKRLLGVLQDQHLVD